MSAPEQLPAAFDPSKESDKFLAKIKTKASTKFSRTRKDPLKNAMKLAQWLYVYEKENEAMDVCEFLGKSEFAGNFRLWCWVEHTLALQSRMLRQRGQDVEADACLQRIKEAGFVDERLSGRLLNSQLSSIDDATATGDKTGVREWSLIAFSELCVITELGGSEKLPVATLEQKIQSILSQLRSMKK